MSKSCLTNEPVPTILHREKCLDGRGTLLTYERDPSAVYLRVWKPETSTYSTRKVAGVSSIEEARKSVLETFLDLSGPTPVKRPRRGQEQGTVKRPHRQRIDALIEKWLSFQQERVDKGVIDEKTRRSKKQSFNIFLKYFEEEEIVYTDQIDIGCFDSYELFRAAMSPWTRKREMKHLGEFIRWMARYKYIESYLALTKDLLPKIVINDEDYDSNPPWRQSDLRLFWEEVHRWVKEVDTGKNNYFLIYRRQIWTLFKTLRDSGLRPAEALYLTWSDLEFENYYRFSPKKFKYAVEDLKKKGLPWKHLQDLPEEHPEKFDLGKMDRYVVHIRTLDTKTKRNRLVSCNGAERLLKWREWLGEYVKGKPGFPQITPKSPVFALPQSGSWRRLTHSSYQGAFRDTLMENLKDRLRGAEMTARPYHVYSFRSTRAQELKANGVEIGLAAEQMGHTPDVMSKIYARLPVKALATREAAKINYGYKRRTQILNIFPDEET